MKEENVGTCKALFLDKQMSNTLSKKINLQNKVINNKKNTAKNRGQNLDAVKFLFSFGVKEWPVFRFIKIIRKDIK